MAINVTVVSVPHNGGFFPDIIFFKEKSERI